MQQVLSWLKTDLVGRWDGPLWFRLIMQPVVASLLAIRAGLRDAREGRPPFGMQVLTDADHRKDLLKEGWADVARLFAIAVIIDCIYEVIEFRQIYFGQSLIVALCVAVPPYILLRGPVNRLARRSKPGTTPKDQPPASH